MGLAVSNNTAVIERETYALWHKNVSWGRVLVVELPTIALYWYRKPLDLAM
jgi:hypothetical protein